MNYDENRGIATFGREYPGATDSFGGALVVRTFQHDAEVIARALQRAFKAGQRDRSAELSRLLADRDR